MNNTLALCMMVKNEAGTLHRALASAVDVVDEVCVLDTGSTDGQTIQIARRFAHRFHQRRWDPFHFAEARNASVAMTKCDYVLILDGDEYLSDDVAWHDLRETLRREQPGSVSVTLLNHLGGGTMRERLPQRRVFRRDAVRWEGRVHHYLADDPARPITIDATLHHRGFDLTEEERLAKYAPRVALNRKAAKENRAHPKRYAHYRYKLAESLMMTQQFKEAAALFKWCYQSEQLKHIRLDVGAYWVKALLRCHTHDNLTLDRRVAVPLARTMVVEAGGRGEPVPLFFASWLLMLCEQEVAGLRMMALAHEYATKPGHKPRREIDEAPIRHAIAGFMTQAGMVAMGEIIADDSDPATAARVIQELAEAFTHNHSPLAEVPA